MTWVRLAMGRSDASSGLSKQPYAGAAVLTRTVRVLRSIMFNQHPPIRELRRATIALFLAAGFEGLRQIFFPGFSVWRSHIAIPLLCASLVALMVFELLCNRQWPSLRPELGSDFSGPS